MDSWQKKDVYPWLFLGITWKDEPDDHNYKDAQDYMSLVCSDKDAARIVAELRDASMQKYRARDILRAARLSRLEGDQSRVEHDLEKVALEPVLLVRSKDRLHIADGYHRVNAALVLDQDAVIPCKITSL